MAGSAGARTISLDPAAGGISIPRLYFALLRQRFTGTIELTQRDPAGRRTVWVRGGLPVFTDWVESDERLGELLARAGLIDDAGLQRALAAHASGNGLLGEILVGLGLIDEAMRTEALRDQCVRKLVHTFAVTAVEPEVTVTATEHAKGKDDELGQINVLALLLRGIKARYTDAQITAELGEALASDLVATPALARYERQFGFERDDAPILGALARGVSMARLLAPGVDPHRARRLIYTLWAAQMLRTGDDAIQSIAKGATAAAAAQQAGVTIGAQAQGAPPSSPSPAAKPTPPSAASRPKPKPTPPSAASPPKAEPKPDDDTDEFQAKLAALEAKVAAETHAFALFDLEIDAERKQIRAAWAELSKTFHPDALEGAGRSNLRGRVERVFAALSEAYGVLSDKAEREQLREAIAAGGSKVGEDTAAVVRNAFEAERLARDADKQLHARQWDRAAELFARALELSPEDSDIAAALLYAEFRRGDAGDAPTAIAKLTTLVEATPNCARAHYFKGLLQLGIDDTANAKHSFATALKLDRRNIDAERQLRAINLRERGPRAAQAKAKEDKKRGLFGLFKKD